MMPQTTIKWETWVLRKYAIKAGAHVYIGGDTLLKLTFKLHSQQTVRESCSNTWSYKGKMLQTQMEI